MHPLIGNPDSVLEADELVLFAYTLFKKLIDAIYSWHMDRHIQNP